MSYNQFSRMAQVRKPGPRGKRILATGLKVFFWSIWWLALFYGFSYLAVKFIKFLWFL